MLKSNITLPPKKKNLSPVSPGIKTNEKKITEIINKGGSTTNTTQPSDELIKNFNIKILESELANINAMRAMSPKPRGKSIAISLHDWIIEAIKEKIERDKGE